MIKLKLESLTDIGCKRKENQDNYWCARLDVNGEEVGVACLCDGMGGLDKGAYASKVVVEEVREFFKTSIDVNELKGVIRKAHETLHNVSKRENISLGTTCTVVILKGGIYEILHIGDSRCYHLNNSKLEDKIAVITKDHTVIEKYREAGKELPPHLYKKYKNTLTRCIGVSERMELDHYKGGYNEGDIFLVCSDGFWHYLREEDFSSLENLSSLVKKYIKLGETDNISAAWLQV